jgi:uncharacterized protein YodC (DUF2158 family)
VTNKADQWIIDAYNEPDPKPFVFVKGQIVRLKKGRSDDGQTPECWDGAKVVVVSMYSSGLLKDHWYKVLLKEINQTCDFEEDEFDLRYAKRS